MISNLILLNLVCIVFKPKRSKLYCPNIKLDCDTLEYFSCTCTKYLGFTFNMNCQDDDDMLRQMRTLYSGRKRNLDTSKTKEKIYG